jgi:hypothetical protein
MLAPESMPVWNGVVAGGAPVEEPDSVGEPEAVDETEPVELVDPDPVDEPEPAELVDSEPVAEVWPGPVAAPEPVEEVPLAADAPAPVLPDVLLPTEPALRPV